LNLKSTASLSLAKTHSIVELIADGRGTPKLGEIYQLCGDRCLRQSCT
jgi:hypothetical protein